MRLRSGLLLLLCLSIAAPVVAACGEKKSSSSKNKDKDDDDDDDDQGKGKAKAPPEKKAVLSRIEAFKAPPMDPNDLPDPYDSIKRSLELKAAGGDAPGAEHVKPLPPTLTDTLLADFRTITFYDFGKRLDAPSITVEETQRVVDFYAKTEWKKIRGYRPWAHKKFFETLSEEERKELAREAADYLKKNGFKGSDNLPPGDPPLAGPTAVLDTPTATAASIDTPLFAGTYSSAWGVVVLEQTKASASTVTGKYPRGTISCTATGVKLDCTWAEGSSKGLAVFTQQANGDLHGTWGGQKSASSGGPWNLTRTKPGELK